MGKSPSKKEKSILACLLRKKNRAHYFAERSVRANESRMDYPNNSISTSKYTAINFLPKNLFFQFSKLANDYFVAVGLLQLIKEISTSNGVPFVFLPLSVIIALTMLKDVAEDHGRHKSDSEENNKQTKVFKDGKFLRSKWRDLRVGDVILVKEDEYFPADMLILHTSGKKGICFVETKNLDGETNLKQKQAHKDISADFENPEKIAQAKNLFNYEKANDYIYKFVGSIETSAGMVSLGEQNFALRGCSLKNTEFVIGLVAYTGHHTKIMLNSVKAKPKLSQLEKAMNKRILRIFIVQLCFCLFSGLYAAIWYAVNHDTVPYLMINENADKDNSFAYNLFVRFGNWFLLLNGFVPISLLVTLEMVKVFQGIVMTRDRRMISKDKISTTVQSSNLNEELGQINYVFSDKTGTLTQNLMEFKNLCVGQRSYGDARDLVSTAGMPQVTNVDFLDQNFIQESNDPRSANYENIKECLIALAVCHTIIAETKDKEIVYNASSPDELALVNFAKFVGSEFVGIDEDNNMEINFKGTRMKFQLLHVLEFNSARKRMSVILRLPHGRIVLYSKGADTILFDRILTNDPNVRRTQTHLSYYANKGLRTLVLAKRVLDPAFYRNWSQRYHEATVQIEGREEAMEVLQSEIEADMKLVGATAIEDKLQDDVGQTISKLQEAGIKVWVLTGDKVETAINIGFSCKLLNDTFKQLIVTEKTFEDVSISLDEKIEIIKNSHLDQPNFALIISGEALVHAVKPGLSKKVMAIAEHCRSVLACRVSPKQKQEVVSLVRREKPEAKTLAIGDGANDVYMISAANVGIGIRGVEGQQAARASDFAIGEFKILSRLLFFYGRESYRKNAYLILYNFYKNIILLLPHFWFGFESCFSGRFVFEQINFQFYNLCFTSVPIIIYAVFDQEYNSTTLVNNPSLYIQGIENKLFNATKFWKWFAMGIWESGLIAAISFLSIDNEHSTVSGREIGSYGQGMLLFSNAVWVANFKILVMSNKFNLLNVFLVFASMAFYIMLFCIVSAFTWSDIYHFPSELLTSGNFYVGSILAVAVTYLLHMAKSRNDHLIESAKYLKAKPDESEAQKLLEVNNAAQIEMEFRAAERDFVDLRHEPEINLQPTRGNSGKAGFAGKDKGLRI